MRFATGVSYPDKPATEIIDFKKGRMSVIIYGVPNAVAEGDGVLDGVGVDVGGGVFVGTSVKVGGGVNVYVGVAVGVLVAVDVLVFGWKGVEDGMVAVAVGVSVTVGVRVMVLVKISGVTLMVGVRGVTVDVVVTEAVGVACELPLGASESAINPMQ
jgi:hypothetical protein